MRGNRELRSRMSVDFGLHVILLYQDKAQEVIDLLADQDDRSGVCGLCMPKLVVMPTLRWGSDRPKLAMLIRIALADTSQTVNRGLVQMKLIDLPEDAHTGCSRRQALTEREPVDRTRCLSRSPVMRLERPSLHVAALVGILIAAIVNLVVQLVW